MLAFNSVKRHKLINKTTVNYIAEDDFLSDKSDRVYYIPIHKPDIKEKAFFLLSGLLVSVPFALFFSQFYVYLPVNLSAILSAILFAPFIEELAKVYPIFYRHGETERSLVTLGILVGLGFGITELILYVTVLGVPILDRLPGVIFHASSAGVTAFGVAKKNPAPYYLLSVFLHSMNNLVAFSNFVILTLAVQTVIVITTFLLVWHFYHKTSDEKVVL